MQCIERWSIQVTLHNHQHAQMCRWVITFSQNLSSIHIRSSIWNMCILKSETSRHRSCVIQSSIDQIAYEERTREVQQSPKLHLESQTVSIREWLHRVSFRGPPLSGRGMMTWIQRLSKNIDQPRGSRHLQGFAVLSNMRSWTPFCPRRRQAIVPLEKDSGRV
jgi:hypothetical protein